MGNLQKNGVTDLIPKELMMVGSGGGSVSRAVASDSRDLRSSPNISKVLSTN